MSIRCWIRCVFRDPVAVLYPSPVGDRSFVGMTLQITANLHAELITLTRQTVPISTFNPASGKSCVSLSVGSLLRGIYTLWIGTVGRVPIIRKMIRQLYPLVSWFPVGSYRATAGFRG
jgi:hypothetical protein